MPETPVAPAPSDADAAAFVAVLAPVERLTLFGVLVAQVHDIHALAYTFSDEQITAAESLCEMFEGQPGLLAQVTWAAAAVTAHEIDHLVLPDAVADAGVLLLAALESEFGPIFADGSR